MRLEARKSISQPVEDPEQRGSVIPRRSDVEAAQGDTVLHKSYADGDAEPLALKDQSLILQ